MKKRVITACLTFGLLLWLLSVALSAGAASEPANECVREYRVQSGDTMSRIASRFGLSLRALIDLNRDQLSNPDRIYVGQTLCLAVAEPTISGATPTPTPAPSASALAIEITHRFPLTDTEMGWNLTTRGGLVGKRTAYVLQESAPYTVVSDTAQMIAELTRGPIPLLLAVQNSQQAGAATHTLVAIEDKGPLATLLPSQPVAPRQRCLEPAPLLTVLAASTGSTEVRVFVEENGVASPLLNITGTDYMAGRADAVACYTGAMAELIDFALLPGAEAGTYRAVMRDRPSGGELVVTADYRLTEEGAKQIGRESVRRRISYTVMQTDFFSTTEGLLSVFRSPQAPVLLAFRDDDFLADTTYTLATIGDAGLVDALSLREVLTPSLNVTARAVPQLNPSCEFVDARQLAGPLVGAVSAVTVTVSLEDRDGTFFPFPVSGFVSRATITDTLPCYGDDGTGAMSHRVGFVLSPAGGGSADGYRATVQLQGDKIGPPGILQAARCRYWPSRGRFNRWLRSWFGCR